MYFFHFDWYFEIVGNCMIENGFARFFIEFQGGDIEDIPEFVVSHIDYVIKLGVGQISIGLACLAMILTIIETISNSDIETIFKFRCVLSSYDKGGNLYIFLMWVDKGSMCRVAYELNCS